MPFDPRFRQHVQFSPDTQELLDCLRATAAETLERKRRLGHYAVVWQDGKPVLIGEDAPGQADHQPPGG